MAAQTTLAPAHVHFAYPDEKYIVVCNKYRIHGSIDFCDVHLRELSAHLGMKNEPFSVVECVTACPVVVKGGLLLTETTGHWQSSA